MNIFQRFVSESQAVLKTANKRSTKVLSQFGAFTRRTAKGLIRKAKKPSAPGRPPHGHGQQLLKKFLFFAIDPRGPSVIIGPARLNGTLGDAPHALEYGGRTEVNAGTRRRPKFKTVTIAARPYIGPAADRELKNLPSMWAQSGKTK